MVQVRAHQPVNDDGSINLEAWLEHVTRVDPALDRQALQEACEFARDLEQQANTTPHHWSEDASTFRAGLDIAEILADLKLDQDSLVAAIIYRGVREGKITLAAVHQRFGPVVAKLIEGVLRMAAISASINPRESVVVGSQTQVENLRKMLVAMVDDVRVALIKLAERTCAIRAIKEADEEKRQRVAREVFDIYAPLAHRLGIGHIKWELEDLSFRYLEPEQYKQIAKLLHERRLDREQYINDAMAHLRQELEATGIKADISGRAKHIYSIWRKMQRKGLQFSQIYDVRAVRVLVPEVRDCYTTLGIVHTLWRHIPKEFDDYIANPKENGYRSLHTAVLGPEGKVLEVQIRTHAMHEEAELGVCAHWRYKGTDVKSGSNHYEEKISWLRQVIEWHEELGDIGGLAEQLRVDIEPDRVYVFTPDGHAIDLPKGATPLDFAYRVHTEIGHNCRGAKINGRIVPLTYSLQTGEQVEIITSKQGTPSRDWLNSNLGYVTTSRARAKIVHWFKLQDRDQNVAAGKQLLERELARLALVGADFDKLAEKANLKTAEDLFAALGAGDVRLAHAANLAQQLLEPERSNEQLELIPRKAQGFKPGKRGDIQIQGVGNLLTQMAGCCQPLPGDPIVGYITLGRGVTIHRQDCPTALQQTAREPERMIQVSWGPVPVQTYPVEIVIKAYDRSGLLRDVTQVLLNEKLNVLAVNTRSNKEDNTASMSITVEIPGLDALGRLLARIGQLPNIIEARRHRVS
ncbi:MULTISPECIES: GTP diphosphokinase [Pseudomonadaceae]|uniref:GTP pyrophosphokinase n=1 Tax=Ectopseudomonas alcaliphila TaxID=101564 RepID=A0A1G6TN24_9GAMM|nr:MULTISPECIES: GTP diphosphokinase [Pseudomonas]PKM33869.1 MAG: GTP diphosphokinase [Gammaproteobacteria bacterium HGW-Gammaproteobacteria-12]MDP9939962.1 GTP pyrophosphokinase [Pseudomonas sp. 3400]MDR7012471.1 GTP pyrophosphokinase [Pseudomonas alcaliphila]MDX5991327.1 GTP diphosphokinase [Pseudomonas alcaliphila]SDD30274.1 GTP pyrophosphokinase [Pseudomonas alcaliphila]